VQPPCTVEETWTSILARVAVQEARAFEPEKMTPSDGPLVV
jgi:hypothetical protein